MHRWEHKSVHALVSTLSPSRTMYYDGKIQAAGPTEGSHTSRLPPPTKFHHQNATYKYICQAYVMYDYSPHGDRQHAASAERVFSIPSDTQHMAQLPTTRLERASRPPTSLAVNRKTPKSSCGNKRLKRREAAEYLGFQNRKGQTVRVIVR